MAAKEATRGLREEHQRLLSLDLPLHQSTAKRRKLVEELPLETEEMVDDVLTTEAHYNFPKIHLISYFVEQISRYGSLPQYSTEICEALYKPLKDAYCRSNHINPMPQIIQTYTRAHSFAMRERNLEEWTTELEHIPQDIKGVIRPTHPSLHLPQGTPLDLRQMRLQGPISTRRIFNLSTLQDHYQLPDLKALTTRYLIRNPFQDAQEPQASADQLIDAPLEAFNTLQVPIPTFNNDGYLLHRIHCTGPNLFRKQEKRNDWVFVRRRKSATQVQGSLRGRVPAKLNALFKLRDLLANTCYHLAHVSLLTIIGSPTPDGLESMILVGKPMKSHVIRVADIEGMAHLVIVNPEELYLVNNRIDVHTRNDIHDGN